jgi:hypothetical protein
LKCEFYINCLHLITLEDHLIRLFVTAFPFGLNDKIEHYGNVGDTKLDYKTKNSPYFTSSIPRRKRSHGRKKQYYNRSINQSIATFSHWWSTKQHDHNQLDGFYQLMRSLQTKGVNGLAAYLFELEDYDKRLVSQAICAFLSSRPLKSVENKPKTKFNYLVVPFMNKAIELLKLENLLRLSKIRKELPEDIVNDFINYRITYKSNPPISLSTSNYGKFLQNLDNTTVEHILNTPCDCHDSRFLYTPANHIVTGNLEIVSDSFTRMVLSKGAKFRLAERIDFPNTQTTVAKVIFNYFQRIATKKNIPMSSLLKPLKIAYNTLNARIRILMYNNSIDSVSIRAIIRTFTGTLITFIRISLLHRPIKPVITLCLFVKSIMLR